MGTSSRQIIGWLILSQIVMFAWLPSLHAQTTIEGVRVRPSPERTRIVFDLGAPVEHKIFSLSDPMRLVIDIEDARLSEPMDDVPLGDTPIKSMRASEREKNNLRVVLDLASVVKPRSFVLKHRLLTDLQPKIAHLDTDCALLPPTTRGAS